MGKTRTNGREKTNGSGVVTTPEVRRVGLEIALDSAREDLLGVATRSRLEILAAMLEQDRELIVGPKHRW